MSVNKILPTSIIKDNPDIRYRSWIEYLEGDDLNMSKSSIRNEVKKFLCNNILYNNEVFEIDGSMYNMEVLGKGYSLIFMDGMRKNEDIKLFQKYGKVRSYFVKLKISYDMLMNDKVFVDNSTSDFKVVPIVYKDFYYDIDVGHMLNDYSSFSTIVDFMRGIIYINDVLLDYMKRHNDKTFDVLCNILVKRDEFVHVYNDKDDPDVANVLDKAHWTENNRKVYDIILNDNNEVPDLKFDYLPKDIKMTLVYEQQYGKANDKYFISIINMPYRIYSNYISNMTGALYYNNEFGYFSQDKNRTALNVLAYDICKNGILKPLVFKMQSNKLIAQDKARLLVAQYLKLPCIPAVVYWSMDYDNEVKCNKINLLDKENRIILDNDDIELKRTIFPNINDLMLFGLEV